MRSLSNLPPGVRESDIPGCGPDDEPAEWDEIEPEGPEYVQMTWQPYLGGDDILVHVELLPWGEVLAEDVIEDCSASFWGVLLWVGEWASKNGRTATLDPDIFQSAVQQHVLGVRSGSFTFHLDQP